MCCQQQITTKIPARGCRPQGPSRETGGPRDVPGSPTEWSCCVPCRTDCPVRWWATPGAAISLTQLSASPAPLVGTWTPTAGMFIWPHNNATILATKLSQTNAACYQHSLAYWIAHLFIADLQYLVMVLHLFVLSLNRREKRCCCMHYFWHRTGLAGGLWSDPNNPMT